MSEDPVDEMARLREIELLVRELFVLEGNYGALPARAISVEDEHDEESIERRLKELVGLPPSTEPEVQHMRRCSFPVSPCVCRRSHLLAEARRLSDMIPPESQG